jgi:hypothetical protein
VPHLRGKTDAGVVKSRTVEWRFDTGESQGRERSAWGSTP